MLVLCAVDQATISPRRGSNPPAHDIDCRLLSARERGHRAQSKEGAPCLNYSPSGQTLPGFAKRPNSNCGRCALKGATQSLRRPNSPLARQYGFPSWRALKAHVDGLSAAARSAIPPLADGEIARFLRAVGDGRLDEVRAMVASDMRFINAVGPHPY